MPRKGQGSGIGLHAKGYLRHTRRGPLYHKLVHRVVMADACRLFCYYPLGEDGLPAGFDTHHMDFNKKHNCLGNLLLIEHALHWAADQSRREDNQAVIRESYRSFEDVE